MIEGFTQAEINATLAALNLGRAVAEGIGKKRIEPDAPMATAHTKLLVTLGMSNAEPFEAMGVPSCN